MVSDELCDSTHTTRNMVSDELWGGAEHARPLSSLYAEDLSTQLTASASASTLKRRGLHGWVSPPS